MDNFRTYAMLAKPVADSCNLACEYCYYADKNRLLQTNTARMSLEVLETYIRQSLEMHGRDAVVEFAWHGGEPTLAGVEFYQTALKLQEKYGSGRKIRNTLQTNASCLTDELCQLFHDHNFLVGVSIDGPEKLHNAYRRTGTGKPSFGKTMEGIELLRRYNVSFNTLTTVNSANMDHPREVYSFLRELTDYMQFLPVVESVPAQFETEKGQKFAIPPGVNSVKIRHPVTAFSVTPEGYGDFLCQVFDVWKEADIGKKHVQIFDVTLENLRGVPASLCVHNPLCGHSGCVEANGDVYSCDRYAFREYRLGNILERSLGDLMEQNRTFGMHKTYGLSRDCFQCSYIRLCYGGCPKDRLWEGKNYLCQGYQMFFRHLTEHLG